MKSLAVRRIGGSLLVFQFAVAIAFHYQCLPILPAKCRPNEPCLAPKILVTLYDCRWRQRYQSQPGQSEAWLIVSAMAFGATQYRKDDA